MRLSPQCAPLFSGSICSGGDKQAEAFMELAFDPIDFSKDGILLTGKLENEIGAEQLMIIIIIF